MPKRPVAQTQQTSLSKRQKTAKQKSSSHADTLAEILRLEKLVENALASNSSLNPLADLLHIASASDGEDESVLKAIFAIYRLFVQIARKNLLVITEKQEPGTDDGSKQRSVIRAWIAGKLDGFTEILCGLLKDEEKELRASSLKILFSLLREISTAQRAFDVKLFKKIVFALLTCPSSHRTKENDAVIESDTREQLCNDWLNTKVDVRWYFLRETGVLVNDRAVVQIHPLLLSNAISILEHLRNIPQSGAKSVLDCQETNEFLVEHLSAEPKRSKRGEDEDSDEDNKKDAGDEDEDEEKVDDWRKFFDEDPKPSVTKTAPNRRHRRIHAMNIHEQLHSVASHRAVFTKCWMTLLPLLTIKQSSRRKGEEGREDVLVSQVLKIMHHSILPYLTRPLLVMDWIAGCVDHGGIVGLLALNGLFVLISQYNLDYPRFYTKLYSFLDRDVLHFKHQSRFFRLLELFLSSTHLPLTLLASFLKRLARLSLNAPPAAVVPIIPFTYNQLKRHPALMVLIHRATDDGASSVDPFLPSEEDPTQTGAFESSLWELISHSSHYHSVIATFARMFSDAFTKSTYNMEDFLDHTYGTMFATEIKRKIKNAPALQIQNIAQPALGETIDAPLLKGTLFCI